MVFFCALRPTEFVVFAQRSGRTSDLQGIVPQPVPTKELRRESPNVFRRREIQEGSRATCTDTGVEEKNSPVGFSAELFLLKFTDTDLLKLHLNQT